jgi:hypothetical protein
MRLCAQEGDALVKPPADLPRNPDASSASSPSAHELPPRVRSLLDGILERMVARLEPAIAQSIEDFERELSRMADQPTISTAQARCFETLRAFRSRRAELFPRFLANLQKVLFAFGPSRPEAEASLSRRGELTLVSESEIEIATAIAETGGRAEVRASVPLYLLGQRFGVLAGAPAFEADRLPVGPRMLSRLFLETVADIEMPSEHRVLLLRQFERQLLTLAPTLYETLNAFLVGERILPNLSFAPVRPRPAAPQPEEPRTRTLRDDGEGARLRQKPMVGEAPTTRSSSASPPSLDRPGTTRGRAHPTEFTPSWIGVPAPAPIDEGAAPARELFDAIRELLASRRQIIDRFASRQDAARGHRVSASEVDEALRALQRRPLGPVYAGGRIQAPNVQHLKQDLLAQLRAQVPEGLVPRLSEEDADIIDLVGMLFEQIMRDLKPSGMSQLLLAKLQAPLLRAALKDRSFFVERSHPARRLLNSILETGMYWLDAEEADRELVDKMHHLVDRISADFDGDLRIFELMLEDLSGYMQTIARRAEVAERRHVEAARGRERLELARERALAAIAARTEGKPLAPVLRQVLEQTWTDVLALTELRHGEDSPIYRRRLEIADTLIASEGIARAGGEALSELRREIEQGLALVGLTPADAQRVASALFASTPRQASEDGATSVSRAEVSLRLANHGRMGGDGLSPKREERPPNAEEQAMIERIQRLPFGTWVEFVVNQQGDRVRRRLSWFSPLTGRCLFVNQRGQKVDERSLVSLARELVRGNARILEGQSETMIDRAWRQVLDALRSFVGGRAKAQPSEAS